MYLDKATKSALFKKFSSQRSANDTGSSESQIALFTYRIKHLTEHLNVNKKDHATRLSLIKMVGKRKKLLKYLWRRDIKQYREILKTLGIRK